MSLAAIVALLQTALLLLQMAQGPNVPPTLKTQAINTANQAIAAATQAMSHPKDTVTVTITPTPKPTPTPVPPPVQPPSLSAPMGWDFDMKTKCARTTGIVGDINYYSVNDQCGTNGKHWLLAVESEKTPGQSAPGPVNRSFLINGADSPISLEWLPHTSTLGQNWTAHMKVDMNAHPHPNGSGYFTYFGMMDHVDQHGGPLPAPLNLSTSHALSFTYYVPGADDAARMLVGAQFWWGGKAHILEIDLALTQWGDAHPDPKAILVSKDWYGDDGAEYVVLDGTQMGLGIPLQKNTEITIPWGKVLSDVLAKGWFSPIGTQPSVTQAVYIGTEVKNRAIGDLWQTDFRVSSTTIQN